MANVKIGRLALHVTSMSPAAARELASGVAGRVASSAAGASASVPRLRVDLPHVEGESARALEARVALAVERALLRG
jgi:hypothetical protein